MCFKSLWNAGVWYVHRAIGHQLLETWIALHRCGESTFNVSFQCSCGMSTKIKITSCCWSLVNGRASLGYSQITFASSALRSVGDLAAGSRGSSFLTFDTVSLIRSRVYRNTAPMRFDETFGALQSQEAQATTKDANQSPTGRSMRLFVSKDVALSLVFASIKNEQTIPSHDRQTRHVERKGARLRIDLTASGKSRCSLKSRCSCETLSGEEAETWNPVQMLSNLLTWSMSYSGKRLDKLNATQEGFAGNLLVWPHTGYFVTVHNHVVWRWCSEPLCEPTREVTITTIWPKIRTSSLISIWSGCSSQKSRGVGEDVESWTARGSRTWSIKQVKFFRRQSKPSYSYTVWPHQQEQQEAHHKKAILKKKCMRCNAPLVVCTTPYLLTSYVLDLRAALVSYIIRVYISLAFLPGFWRLPTRAHSPTVFAEIREACEHQYVPIYARTSEWKQISWILQWLGATWRLLSVCSTCFLPAKLLPIPLTQHTNQIMLHLPPENCDRSADISLGNSYQWSVMRNAPVALD